jgi:hypothetical protein
VGETSYQVKANGLLKATLPANATSTVLTGLQPDFPYSIEVTPCQGGNTGAAGNCNGTPKHSLPPLWSELKLDAFASESGGAPGTYWARSSSHDNSSGLLTSPLRLTFGSTTVKNGDSFYVGKRGEWKCWILATTHFSAGAVSDPETFVYDATGSTKCRLLNPDGSTKVTYDSGRIRLVIKWEAGVYLMSVLFSPSVPDANMTGPTQLCTDVPLTGTQVQFRYQ